MNKKLKRIARIAVLTAVALIMYFVESALPPVLAFAPGTKIGLGNIISLIALITLCYTDAYIILVARCLLAAVFGGNIAALMYSLPAGLASLTVMILLYRFLCPRISLVAVSLAGAIIHNLTQLTIASLVVSNFAMLTMLPLMLGASVLAGFFVGLVSHYVIKALPEKVYR